MTIWVDAQLSPRLACWLSERFEVNALPVRDVGLRDASDTEIFEAARSENAIVITKDFDFVELAERLGPPPQILWLTCGNTTEQRLREIFEREFAAIREMFEAGEALVEIH